MTFPDVKEALFGWETTTTFKQVIKQIADHQVTEKSYCNPFQGVFQPSEWQRVLLKPEGQRLWRWWNLITVQALNLDDIIVDAAGVEYRVMQKLDWSQGGYFVYELTEAFRTIQ